MVYRFEAADHETDCSVLINAAGPWVNRILDCVSPAPPKLDVDLVQGTHIIVPAPTPSWSRRTGSSFPAA